MKMVVHYPQALLGREELGRRTAVLHARGIVQAIQALSCPREDKLALWKEILARLDEMDRLEKAKATEF